MTSIVVRPYRADDRQAVRDICFRTGYMGEPIRPQWSDLESFADVFSSYYTDREPQSSLVAEQGERVVGYLFGCRNTKESTGPATLFLARSVSHFLGMRRGTARFVWRAAADVTVDALRRDVASPRFIDSRWPAHLHINLLPEARGRGAGHQLMERWHQLLLVDGSPGCHLETLAENTAAIGFFTRCGYVPFGDAHPAPGLRAPDGSRHHIQIMVFSLTGPSGELRRNT